MVAQTNHSILKNENRQGKEKVIFSIFSVMRFFEYNIAYCKLNQSCQCHLHLCNFQTDPEIQHSIYKMVEQHCAGMKEKRP